MTGVTGNNGRGFGAAALSAFSLPGPRTPKAPARARPVAAFARVAGMEAILDPTGALWWPDAETLVVSDLHLETGSSYARTGQMLGVQGLVRRSAPVLVIPVMTTGSTPYSFEFQNEWQRAWAQFRTAGSLIDYVRTSGAGIDPLLLNRAQVGRRGRGWWLDPREQT